MTGIIQYAGRTFEFDFDGPSDSEVAEKALEIQKARHWKPDESTAAARSILIREKRNEMAEQVRGMLADELRNGDRSKAETGISRRIAEPDPKSYSYRERNNNNIDQGNELRTKDDATVETEIKDLVSFLNHRRFEKRQQRLDAITAKGGHGTRDADARVDVEITMPTSPRGEMAGNPNGPRQHELAMQFAGAGDHNAQYAQQMKYLDRYDHAYLPQSRELVGYTFITRPRCNFSSGNLANVSDFAALLHAPTNSVGMAIRGYLDTKLYEDAQFSDILDSCPFFDGRNPFLVPAVNALKSINGYPDINLSTETTEGGFFSEAQTSVTGYDRLAKGQELTLTFRDYYGSPILALHEYWTKYAGMLQDGTMHEYPEDIEANLMSYTVSIYRFVMDPTNRYILRWSKATGCYPKLAPSGAVFNFGEGEKLVQSINNLSVQYFAHHIGYNNPLILKEFNMLVERYAGEDIANVDGDRILANGLMNNHVRALPYISQRTGMNELQWRLITDRDHKVVTGDYMFPDKPFNEFSGLIRRGMISPV